MLLRVCPNKLIYFLSSSLIASLLCHQFFLWNEKTFVHIFQEILTKQTVDVLAGLFLGKEDLIRFNMTEGHVLEISLESSNEICKQ